MAMNPKGLGQGVDEGPGQGSRAALRRRIDDLAPWPYNMDLGGIATAPGHALGDPAATWRRVAPLLPQDLAGASVLDIGCSAGFFSLEMKRRGAAEVVAIDADPRLIAQAALAAEVNGLAIDLRQLPVYEVESLGRRFDIVLFMGGFRHLRHPLLALDLVHQHVAGELMLFVTPPADAAEAAIASDEGPPRMEFVEGDAGGGAAGRWSPNGAGVEALLRSAGFAPETHVSPDIWLCRRATRPAGAEPPPSIGRAYPASVAPGGAMPAGATAAAAAEPAPQRSLLAELLPHDARNRKVPDDGSDSGSGGGPDES